MMEVAEPQEVQRVHSRSISDPIRSSWFLPSLDYLGKYCSLKGIGFTSDIYLTAIHPVLQGFTVYLP